MNRHLEIINMEKNLVTVYGRIIKKTPTQPNSKYADYQLSLIVYGAQDFCDKYTNENISSNNEKSMFINIKITEGIFNMVQLNVNVVAEGVLDSFTSKSGQTYYFVKANNFLYNSPSQKNTNENDFSLSTTTNVPFISTDLIDSKASSEVFANEESIEGNINLDIKTSSSNTEYTQFTI